MTRSRSSILGTESTQKARLEGPGMAGPIAAALRPLQLVPLSWAHLRTHHRPGAGVTALYRVQAAPRPGSAARAGKLLHLQVGATTSSLSGGGNGTTVRGTVENTAVRLWVHPRDPVLSGLPWATSAQAVAAGLFGGSQDRDRPSLRLTAYRPLRRAVIRATYNGSTAYLKVPQPRLGPGLRRRLEAAAAAGLPVPPLLPIAPGAGPDQDCVLALGALPGRSFHQQLSAGPASGFDPAALLDLLAGLPAEALDFSRKPAWAERVQDYGVGAAAALPQMAPRIVRCAGDIDAAVRSSDAGPVVPAHGDFHGGNLLALPGPKGPRISGLLDVDALGPGHRVDDLACFLGHLFVAAALNPRSAGLRSAAERCAEAFSAETGHAALYSRSAAVALTLVAGASGRGSRAAGQALAAAEELLARCRGRF